jgi:hypothetical protein
MLEDDFLSYPGSGEYVVENWTGVFNLFHSLQEASSKTSFFCSLESSWD